MQYKKQIFLRVITYLIGLTFLSLGAVLSVTANLGISPVMTLPFVISQLMGTTFGNAAILFS